MQIVVCIKQVPMVSELPWDSRTGTLKRESAEGMINPACRHALEAALLIKEKSGATITVISMGPPMAEEVLMEALALGADEGVLVSDPRMAGADTLATSHALALTINKVCPSFDLVLCGCHTSDSETAQVGPQLAVELDIPGASYVDELIIKGDTARMTRLSDVFLETLEMKMPGLVTITTRNYVPRYVPMSGVENAFGGKSVKILDAEGIGASPDSVGAAGSATKILSVYSPTTDKENIVLKGAPKKIVESLFKDFGDRLGAAISKDVRGTSQ